MEIRFAKTSELKFETHTEGLLKAMLPARFSSPVLVGAGGQGVVLTVQDISTTNSRIALKLVYFGNRKFVSYIRICREIQIGKICFHPNICQLLEVFSPETSENLSYVILLFETVETTLSEVLRGCGLNPRPSHRTTSSWLYQLLCAVNFLHQRNIIHRDLKPSNIGMTDSKRRRQSSFSGLQWDEVKILDMGMARGVEGERPLTPELGTYSYMAPELLLENHVDFQGVKLSKHNKVNSRPVGMYEKNSGFTNYDKSVDIWAIGVMFAEMLLADGTKFFQSSGVANPTDMLKVILETIPSCETESYQKYVGLENSALLEDLKETAQLKFTIEDRLRENLMPHDEDDLTNLNGDTARDLLKRMLKWDPKERIDAADALRHPYLLHIYQGEFDEERPPQLRDCVHPCSFYDNRMACNVEEVFLKDMKRRILDEIPWSR